MGQSFYTSRHNLTFHCKMSPPFLLKDWKKLLTSLTKYYLLHSFILQDPKFYRKSTVGLNWSETVKKNDRKIRWYFWYLWTFLSWPQVIFLKTLFGHQRALQSFFSKLEFWAENFFGHSFYDKNWFYGSVNLLFVQKWVKMAKRSHLQYFSSFIKNLKMSKILKIWSI